jgi:hypothetical protein
MSGTLNSENPMTLETHFALVGRIDFFVFIGFILQIYAINSDV